MGQFFNRCISESDVMVMKGAESHMKDWDIKGGRWSVTPCPLARWERDSFIVSSCGMPTFYRRHCRRHRRRRHPICLTICLSHMTGMSVLIIRKERNERTRERETWETGPRRGRGKNREIERETERKSIVSSRRR